MVGAELHDKIDFFNGKYHIVMRSGHENYSHFVNKCLLNRGVWHQRYKGTSMTKHVIDLYDIKSNDFEVEALINDLSGEPF